MKSLLDHLTNDHNGFQKLLKHLDSYSKEDLYIGMESTSHYAENLTNFLFTRGFQICIINPIQISSLRKSTIRKTKTDSVDTYLIIKALTLNHYRLFSERDYDSLQLKNLCRFRQNFIVSNKRFQIHISKFQAC